MTNRPAVSTPALDFWCADCASLWDERVHFIALDWLCDECRAKAASLRLADAGPRDADRSGRTGLT